MARNVLISAGKAALILLAALAGTLTAAAAFFGTALVISSVVVMTLVAALVLLAISGGLAWLVAGRILPSRRSLLAGAVAASTLLVVGTLASFTVFRPLGFEPVAMGPEEDGVRFWDLPTGTRVAYEVFPARGEPKETPVIFLHGGPGVPAGGAVEEQVAPTVTGAGFDLYYYDQLGAGLSTRLEDVREYTVERQVRDLEAVRQEIEAEKVILIGGSWGAELGANYMAAHPDRVEKSILFSPGVLYREDDPTPEDEPLDSEEGTAAGTPPRLLAWFGLSFVNPEAAHNFASDREMDGYMDKALNSGGLSSAVCDPESLESSEERGGNGWYVSNMTGRSSENHEDPRPSLRRSDIPTLILRGECETIAWEVSREYREVLDAVLINIPGAGHIITAERPELFNELIRAFLLDEPLPLEPYEDDKAPEFEESAQGGV